MRLAFFITQNFCVRTQIESYNLYVIDFSISQDNMGRQVRFDERSFKNHKIDLEHCQPKILLCPIYITLPLRCSANI